MLNTADLEELEALGCGSDIGKLELQLAAFQDAAADNEPMVVDSVYDQYKRLLERVKPDSLVLSRNWTKDAEDVEIDEGIDYFLNSVGMRSIRTLVNREDLGIRKRQHSSLGKECLTYLVSSKLNGHGFRAVYKYGELVSATTRGRSKNKPGRSLLRHMKKLLPEYVSEWEYTDITEIRGELLVKQSVYDEHLTSRYVSPLFAVSSFVRDSATDEDINMLSAVCYKFLQKDEPFDTLLEEMEHLKSVGFETPYRELVDIYLDEFEDKIEGIVEDWGELYKSKELCDYNCDGIVLALNENAEFYRLPIEEDKNAWQGNLAVKMGVWECNHYVSTIEEIVWEYGKSYIIPKAKIKGVKTVSGQTVWEVPLYNFGTIRKLKITKGSQIHFAFGGETGVTCLTPDGNKISTLKN